MKKTISIIALALALVLMMGCLSACGSRLPAAGTYKLVDLKGDGAEDLRGVMDYFTLKVDADGVGTLTMEGYSMKFTFDKDSDKVDIEGTAATYSVDGKKLTIVNENGFTEVFEKQ